jgi:hypothetical protein
MPITVSGHSVLSEFNSQPTNSRIFIVSGEELDRITEQWKSKWETIGYYDPTTPGVLDVTIVVLLENVNERKISLRELKFSSVPISATKSGILGRKKVRLFALYPVIVIVNYVCYDCI